MDGVWKYDILFWDGDQTEGLISKNIFRMKETLELMAQGQMTFDRPPTQYLKETGEELLPVKKAKKKHPPPDSLAGSTTSSDDGDAATSTDNHKKKKSLLVPIEDGPPPIDELGGGRTWPPDWNRKVYKRKNGNSAGATDRYWYSPGGHKFRSLTQVKKFLNALKVYEGNEEMAYKNYKSFSDA